jgi:hypothetical protein
VPPSPAHAEAAWLWASAQSVQDTHGKRAPPTMYAAAMQPVGPLVVHVCSVSPLAHVAVVVHASVGGPPELMPLVPLLVPPELMPLVPLPVPPLLVPLAPLLPDGLPHVRFKSWSAWVQSPHVLQTKLWPSLVRYAADEHVPATDFWQSW